MLVLLRACSAAPAPPPSASPAEPGAAATAGPDIAGGPGPTPDLVPPDATPPKSVRAGYLHDIATGPGPRVPIVVFRTLVETDGTRTRLPAPPRGQWYVGAVRSGGGFLVSRTATDTEMDGTGYAVVTRLDARGEEERRWLGVPLRVDADAGVALWRDGRAGVRVADLATGRERSVEVAVGAPFALLARNLVVVSPRGRVSLVGPDGQPVTTGATLRSLSASRAMSRVTGLVYGERRRGPVRERSVAVDLASGVVRWTDDRWLVRTVSADGRYVAAISSATGGDPDAVGILDAVTGAEVAELSLLGDGIGEAGVAFEPDGSLLVQVYRPTRRGLTWSVLRLRTDRGVERATRVFATGGYEPPFAF